MPAEVIGKADARRKSCRVGVVERAVVAVARQAGHIQLVRAAAVDHWIEVLGRQVLVNIADVAGAVVKRAVDVHAGTQVYGEISRHLPVVLREEAVNVGVIVVVENPTAAETERGDALQEVLPVGEAAAVIEEDLAVESLRELLVKVHAGIFAAKPEIMWTLHPADCVHKIEVVLNLKLVRGGRWPNLKSRRVECEFIDGLRDVVRWPVDSQICGRNRRRVQQTVVHPDIPKPEVVDHGWCE
jgi:hypothetical protein